MEDSVIESFHADHAFEAWQELRGLGLGSQSPTPDLINQSLYKEAGQKIQQALIVTAIAGAFAAIAAFVDRKKTK